MEEQQPQQTESQPMPEGLLNHYTGQRGLLGILGNDRNPCIWATHVRYLNDESEFLLGWKHAWRALEEKINASNLPEDGLSSKKSLINRIGSARQTLLQSEYFSPEYSIFCFCLTDDRASDLQNLGFEGDRLSQWRGYSKAGYGFSLGFDASVLTRSFAESGKEFQSLRPCEYMVDKQNEQIMKLVDSHLDEIVNTFSTPFMGTKPANRIIRSTKLSEQIQKMYSEFIDFGMFIKHHGFREEAEWRATFNAEDQTKCLFREGRIGPIPYLSIGLDLSKSPSPLKRIVVGPAPHQEESVEAVKFLLRKKGIRIKSEKCPNGVDVVPSEIPYRNW